jgi:hypothetical protein
VRVWVPESLGWEQTVEYVRAQRPASHGERQGTAGDRDQVSRIENRARGQQEEQ